MSLVVALSRSDIQVLLNIFSLLYGILGGRIHVAHEQEQFRPVHWPVPPFGNLLRQYTNYRATALTRSMYVGSMAVHNKRRGAASQKQATWTWTAGLIPPSNAILSMQLHHPSRAPSRQARAVWRPASETILGRAPTLVSLGARLATSPPPQQFRGERRSRASGRFARTRWAPHRRSSHSASASPQF